MRSIVNNVEVMENYKSLAAMLLVQLINAGMALLSKAAIAKGMNPYVFIVYRQAFASISLAPFAFFFESENPSLSYKLVFKIFLVSLCGLTLSLNLYYVAINYTTATFAVAATNTIPALTFIMAVFLRMERLSLRKLHGVVKVLGSVISVSGALVYAFVKGPPIKFMHWCLATQKQTPESMKGSSIEEWIKGSLLMLAANTAWSLWLVLQGPILTQYPARIRIATLQSFFSCIQSACWAIVVERNPPAWKLGWDLNLLSVAYGGVIVSGITFWLQIWVTEKKGPVFTTIFTPLSLIITAIFSTFLWKETLYWGSVGGAVLLVVGIYSVLWGKKKEDKLSTETNEQDPDTKEKITSVMGLEL